MVRGVNGKKKLGGQLVMERAFYSAHPPFMPLMVTYFLIGCKGFVLASVAKPILQPKSLIWDTSMPSKNCEKLC